tara:strand:+ start:397 stop:837 length:441 start_codon:yes stop_codon:yes gene_type:complete
MTKDCYNVSFLCTGNSARSIIAEAILNQEGAGKFKAYSAGSKPGTAPPPNTLDLLEGLNHDIGFARSKSWDEFSGPDAPKMDLVFTVCDNAAAEGSEAVKRIAFAETYRMLRSRISIFVNLPIATLDRMALQRNVDTIGKAPAPAN